MEGYAAKAGEDMDQYENYVSPGFFSTLKIPLEVAATSPPGTPSARQRWPWSTEKFARQYLGTATPWGGTSARAPTPAPRPISRSSVWWATRSTRPCATTIPRQVFFPYLQRGRSGNMTAYVRTDVPPTQMFPVLRAAVRKLDANLPVSLMKTVERQRDDSLSVDRLAATLATAFGVLATLLAAIGLYGVMAFLVARRTREIGLRMALGALTGNVIWLVVREVLLLAGIGVLVGLPVSLAVTRLLASLLYGVNPNDPVSIVLATLGSPPLPPCPAIFRRAALRAWTR